MNRGDDGSFPSSVEEAGALVGMAITQLSLPSSAPASSNNSSTSSSAITPPAGMHSSFRVIRPVASTNLLTRLYQLRALLRSNNDTEPLVAAPSILAVLIKLIGVSTQLAPAYNGSPGATMANSGTSHAADGPVRPPTPPMLSNAIRHLWVDCVTLCHVRGAGLSGSARINTTQFIRQMLALASQNPRSSRAAGGVRIAALDVVTALLQVDDDSEPNTTATTTSSSSLALQTAPWALDILQVCLKALRSAGNGEATYRQSAVQTAVAVAFCSQRAQQLRLQQQGELNMSNSLVLQGGIEDKALTEAVKFMKQATNDKLPEVRLGAAQFCATIAPLLLSKSASTGGGDVGVVLEEVLSLAWRNLDEESAYCVHYWAEAVARILASVLQYRAMSRGGGTASSGSPKKGGGNAAGTGDGGSGDGSDPPYRGSGNVARPRGGRVTMLSQATSLKRTLLFLVEQFVKVGGELVATRMGGAYSTGGRAVRVGIGMVISSLLQLRPFMGEDVSSHLSLSELVQTVLLMLGGPEMEKQLRAPDTGGALGGFGGATRNWSRADAGVVRTIVCRVLRDGISAVSSESGQLALFQDLVGLLPTASSDMGREEADGTEFGTVNANQLQCVLVELSHLISTLGEGLSAKLSELVPLVKICLGHQDVGVRHEAAVVCHAIAVVHSDFGRTLVHDALDGIQLNHAKLMTASAGSESSSSSSTIDKHKGGMSMFRRTTKDKTAGDQETLPHQNAIHGHCVMVSLLLRELPHLSSGLPEELTNTAAAVCEVLIASQFNEHLAKSSGSAACHCVQAGFMILSSIMATGAKGVTNHVTYIFGAWQKASNSAKAGGKALSPQHELVCIDAVLNSVAVFLNHCSELLLAIPEALTQITALLEEILPLLLSDGKFGNIPLTPHISTRLESARASLLESFAWLPAGSYPMAADSVFAFAAESIQSAVYSETSCSILPELLSREDSVLDTCSLSRVKRDGQSGAAKDLDQTVLLLSADFSHHEEREAVLHLQDRKKIRHLAGTRGAASSILSWYCAKNEDDKPPTPLHEVGMWKRPINPSSSAKIRLVDAAIQAFASTFGLKSGKEQHTAMDVLEALVPQYFASLTRTLNSSLTEQSKLKDESAPASNITAVILLCLQSLPLHESTHNIPIGLGPTWMNKAKDILLTLLPSASNWVRRGAAEGLALLATLGVSEDAHFLQSSVLHSLDEVRQGNKPDGKPRTIQLEPVSAARAGSLLTLACIQRTATLVAQRQLSKARGRADNPNTSPSSTKDAELPLLQMMTRILPSIGDYGYTDFFEVRTFALQSFQILLSYSSRLDKTSLDDVDQQLLRKAIEIIEDNVCSAWVVASNDLDKGHENEKIASECAFLAVVVRLMSFVTPHLKHLKSVDNGILSRFCNMARVIMDRDGDHPSIAFEGMIFAEVMAKEARLLPLTPRQVGPSETPRFWMASSIYKLLTPVRPKPYAAHDALFSFTALRSGLFLVQLLIRCDQSLVYLENSKILGLLLATFEAVSGGKQFLGTGLLQSIVLPNRVESLLSQNDEVIGEIMKCLPMLILNEKPSPEGNYGLHLRCLLFAKVLLAGAGSSEEMNGQSTYDKEHVVKHASFVAKQDAIETFRVGNSTRWQTKAVAAQLASCCFGEILALQEQSEAPRAQSHHFNPKLALTWCEKQCAEAEENHQPLPRSILAFHLQDLVLSSCMSSVASLDQSELYNVQASSLHFLTDVVKAFSQVPDPEMPGSDLLHQYSQQIYSVVKHSLGSFEESQTEASFRVFVAGCQTVSTMVKERMTTEGSVLKRILKPLVPPPEQLSFGSIGEKTLDLPPGDTMYSSLVKITRICFAGDLLFGSVVEDNPSFKAAASELIPKRAAFGAECALVAFEGARLLRAKHLSLCGISQDSTSSGNQDITISDYQDPSFIYLTIKMWPSCTRGAVKALTLAMGEDSTTDQEKAECSLWLKALQTLILTGCENSIQLISNDAITIDKMGAFSLDPEVVACECLHSFAILLRNSNTLSTETIDLGTVGFIANLVQEEIIKPLMTKHTRISTQTNLIQQVCGLFRDVACFLVQSCEAEKKSRNKAALFSLLLSPLDILQQGKLTSERSPLIADCLNASLDGAAYLVKNEQLPPDLIKSLISFSAQKLLQSKDDFACILHKSAKVLLLECITHSAVTVNERKRVTLQLAQAGQWDSWGVVYKLNGDVVEKESLEVLKLLMENAAKVDDHSTALAAVGVVVAGADSHAVGTIVAICGAEILGLLHHYGTLSSTLITDPAKRLHCFAESMKVVIVIYTQLLKESFLAEFLSTIFESFIAVLRFNGLPGHPSPQAKGDPSLGRAVAQAVLHVARTSPDQFKASMAAINEQDRAILEFAVRGEMTGYAQTSHGQAPEKKKLNLKGFKK